MKRRLLDGEPSDSSIAPVRSDGELFTGIGFHRTNNGHLIAYSYDKGIRGDRHVPLVALGRENCLMVDVDDTIGGDEDPILFEGRPFTGVVLSFIKGNCTSEEYVDDGCEISSVHWDLDGWHRAFVLSHHVAPSFGETGTYFQRWESPEEPRKVYSISGRLGFRFAISCCPDGSIWRIEMSGFAAKLQNMIRRAAFFPWPSIDGLFRSAFADRLDLVGEDIDDAFLARLTTDGNVSVVRHLVLDETNIRRLDALDAIPALMWVAFMNKKSPDTALASARALKALRPELVVVANGDEL